MEDNQLLELILSSVNSINKRLDSIESDISEMKSDVKEIKSVQSHHTQQIVVIKEQTARNAELESSVKELVKQRDLIKAVLSN